MHFLKLLLIQNMITWSGSRSQICSISSKYDKKIVLLHDLCEHQRKILSDKFSICYQKNEKNPRNASTKFIYVFLFISFLHQMMLSKEGFTSLHEGRPCVFWGPGQNQNWRALIDIGIQLHQLEKLISMQTDDGNTY